MADVVKIDIADIRYGGELAPVTPLRDGEAEPIIVERLTGKDGVYYDLVDGYHRLGSMVAAGETRVTAILPTKEEFRRCREFGGDGDAMTEAEWIEWIQDRMIGVSN